MRVIEVIPHPSITIQIFQMNGKFIVKFEAGPMEQIFKFGEEIKSVEEIKKIITSDFIESVRIRFNEMFQQWKKAHP
jgi:hypothetical protein